MRPLAIVGLAVSGLAVAALLAIGAAAEEPADVAAPPPIYQDGLPAGPTVEERLAEIARRVQAVATYPALARARGEVGETIVAFEIAPNGLPQQIRTRDSSGSLALDRAAERAVREAGPLPRIYGVVAVPVRFQLRAGD